MQATTSAAPVLRRPHQATAVCCDRACARHRAHRTRNRCLVWGCARAPRGARPPRALCLPGPVQLASPARGPRDGVSELTRRTPVFLLSDLVPRKMLATCAPAACNFTGPAALRWLGVRLRLQHCTLMAACVFCASQVAA